MHRSVFTVQSVYVSAILSMLYVADFPFDWCSMPGIFQYELAQSNLLLLLLRVCGGRELSWQNADVLIATAIK